MRLILKLALLVAAFPVVVEAQCTTQTYCVDHANLETLFDSIPEEYITASEALQTTFLDQSVGANINEGMNCMDYDSPSAPGVPNTCKTYLQPWWLCPMTSCATEDYVQHTYDNDHQEVWSRSGGYDNSNWMFCNNGDVEPNPWCNTGVTDSGCGAYGWSWIGCMWDKMLRFDSDALATEKDVFSYQINYLMTDEADLTGDQGFGCDVMDTDCANSTNFTVHKWMDTKDDFPTKKFFLMTPSSKRDETANAALSAAQMMAASALYDLPVVDYYDIMSHNQDGDPCYDTRDGMSYSRSSTPPGSGSTVVENYADDMEDDLAICQNYTTNVLGGHIDVGVGKIRIAKAIRVMLSMLAGWDPNGDPPVGGHITFTVSSVDFGPVVVGSTSQEMATLTNDGDDTVSLDSQEFCALCEDAAEFPMAADNCGATLAASASCTYTFDFTPADYTGYRNTTFTVHGDTNDAVISLTGIAKSGVTVETLVPR